MMTYIHKPQEEILKDLYTELGLVKHLAEENNRMMRSLTQRIARIEEQDTVYSVAEAAAYLNRSPQTIRKYIRLGKFNKVMRGCKEGILKSDLDTIRKP